MTEEINSETAEAPAAAAEEPDTESVRRGVPSGAPEKPKATPDTVIARSPQATKQSNSMTPVNKIASPTLAMTGEDKSGEVPAKSEDMGKLTELETALNETRQSLAARTGDYDRLKATLDDTVSAYRKLAVSSSPLYSDEMISGSTVEEIDASIKKVNGLVKKMRSTLEAEFKDLIIPTGAPERTAPDLSGLSPRDKIKYGIQEKK